MEFYEKFDKFKPRHYQLELLQNIVNNNCKRVIVCWHRRAGKDKLFVNLLNLKMLSEVGSYGYIYPTREQAKKVLVNSVDSEGRRFIDYFESSEIKGSFNKSELKLEFQNGSTFQLFGAEQFDKLRGLNLKGIVFGEYAYCDPNAWHLAINPMLVENKGWVIFQSTMFGKNHFYKLIQSKKDDPNWIISNLTIDHTFKLDGTPIIKKEDLDDPESIIQREYYNDPNATIVGAIFNEYMYKLKKDKRLCPLTIEPTMPVHTYWDLGVSDATAIIFVQLDQEKIKIVYYYEINNTKFTDILSNLEKWRIKNNVIWGKHFVPHDAVNRDGQLENRYLWARQNGFELTSAWTKPPPIQDQIENTYYIWDKIYLDSKRCFRLEECLLQYHRYYYAATDCFGSPVHDWSSHAADAFRLMCWVLRNIQLKNISKKGGVMFNRVGQSSDF